MKKNQFNNPPSALRATSSAREEANDVPSSHSIHHQHRSKNMRNLARTLRKIKPRKNVNCGGIYAVQI